MISFDELKDIMTKIDLRNLYCLEFDFCVSGKENYSKCKIGKRPQKALKNNGYLYWLSLEENNIRLFLSFDEMVSSKIFEGISFAELWDKIEITKEGEKNPKKYFSSLLEKTKNQ